MNKILSCFLHFKLYDYLIGQILANFLLSLEHYNFLVCIMMLSIFSLAIHNWTEAYSVAYIESTRQRKTKFFNFIHISSERYHVNLFKEVSGNKPGKKNYKWKRKFHGKMVFKNISQEWCHMSINLEFIRQKNNGPQFQLDGACLL